MPDLYPSPCFLPLSRFRQNYPLFIYLPGMDGSGALFHRQLMPLDDLFDVRCLSIPPNAQTNWDHLTQEVAALVETELKRRSAQPVYLCGESFGGCLALKLIQFAPQLFSHLILVNPASAFRRSPLLYWGSYAVLPQLESLYSLSCQVFLPFLASVGRIEAGDRHALLQAMQSVTQATSLWRLAMLREFDVTDQAIRQIRQPTLVIGSGCDRLLPSVAEAERLVRLLPHAQMQILPNSGHACLLETDVNLFALMKTSSLIPTPQPQPVAE